MIKCMQLVKAMVFIMKKRIMRKLKGKKGFTLGELLIVVGIISVLVAISIPIFASQLEKAREATDAANIRSQYAQVMTDAIDTTAAINGKERYGAISLKQKKDGWQNAGLQANLNSTFGRVVGSPAANGSAWVEFDGNVAILHFEEAPVPVPVKAEPTQERTMVIQGIAAGAPVERVIPPAPTVYQMS